MTSYNVGASNPMFGRKHTEETKQKDRLAKLGKKNPMWRGDDAGYSALHIWVNNNWDKPEFCELCNVNTAYEWASRGRYTRNREDWYCLCRSCHMESDGRMMNNLGRVVT